MKTTNLMKQTFNVSLASLIGLQSTAMASSGTGSTYFDSILDNSLMNVTAGGIITEKDSSGNVMNTTFHTGSFSFRFGGSFNYPEPIINLSPPKLSAGCGGLSVKGMFASVIGLDRFEEMLKNAGASLAWGIAVGLIYSLPGIGAAFRMIESWASKIQQLLANACQSGMAIGKMISEEWGVKDNALSKTLAEADTAVASLDGMVKKKLEGYGISKYFDDKMVFSGSSASSGTAPTKEEIHAKWKDFLINGLLYYSVSTNALISYLKMLSFNEFNNWQKLITGKEFNDAALVFKHYKFFISLDNHSVSGSTNKVFDLAELFPLSSDISGLSATDKDNLARLFTAAATIRHAGTDLTTNNSVGLNKILTDISCISDSSKTDAEKKVCEAALVSLPQGHAIPFQAAIEDNVNSDNEKLAHDLINYLYFGNTQGKGPEVTKSTTGTGASATTTNTVSTPAGSRELNISALGFNMIVLPSGIEDNQAQSKIFVFYPTSKKESEQIKYYATSSSQKGAKERSLNIMYEVINKGNFNNINSDIPFLVPGIIEKMRIIQQSLPGDQNDLIDILANYNAYHIVRSSIINLIESDAMRETLLPAVIVKNGSTSRVSILSKDISIPIHVREAWSKLNAVNISVLSKLTKSALTFLADNQDHNLISPEDLNRKFKEVELENRKRQLKITPNTPGGY